MGRQSRRDLVNANRSRYRKAKTAEKTEILNHIEQSTGYNRKHLVSLMNQEQKPEGQKRKGNRRPSYSGEVVEILVRLWELENYICAKRLIPFLPQLVESLERHGRLEVPDAVKAKLLTMSAATADRLLKPYRAKLRKSPSLTQHGNLLRKHIQIKTFADWDDSKPGFVEVDTVGHHGGNPNGGFLYSLCMTDVATGWTEATALSTKSEKETLEGVRQLRKRLPFPLLGLDSDNGGEFMNSGLIDYCDENNLTLTRSREYKKNDQCFVEEKNGSVIRRIAGHARYQGASALATLTELYDVLRKYVNFFQPSLKLKTKVRKGATVHRTYNTAKTPFQRLMECDVPARTKKSLQQEFASLDLVQLYDRIRALQQSLLELSSQELFAEEADNRSSALTSTIMPKQTKSIVLDAITAREIGEVWHFKDIVPNISVQNKNRILQQCLEKRLITRVGRGQYVRIAAAADFSQLLNMPRGQGIASSIRNHFLARTEQAVTMTELFHYGQEATVIATVGRLVASGFISRVGRGRYWRRHKKTNMKPYRISKKGLSFNQTQ